MTALFVACIHRLRDVARNLLSYAAGRVAGVPGPDTLLHRVCRANEKGAEIVVQHLLEKGDPVNALINGKSALHVACEHGTLPIVRTLLENGAHVSLVASKLGNLESPLHCAVLNATSDFERIVKLLLCYGANVEARDGFCKTPV